MVAVGVCARAGLAAVSSASVQKMMAAQPGRDAVRRSGYTLTIMRKEVDGSWRLARDANLLVKEA